MWDISVLGSSTHTHQFDSIKQVRVDFMMNSDILMNNFRILDSMGCTMFLLIGFVFTGFLTSLNYWVFSILVILGFWEAPWKFGRFRIEIHRTKKLETHLTWPGEPCKPEPLGTNSVRQDLACLTSLSAWGHCLSFRICLAAPLKAPGSPGDPISPTSFCTSS